MVKQLDAAAAATAAAAPAIQLQFQFAAAANHHAHLTCLVIIQHLSMQGNEEPFPSLLYYGTLLHDFFFVAHLRTPVQQYNGISKIPRP